MTTKTLPQTKAIDPLLMSIATGMKVRFQGDDKACRAIDRALEILGADLPMEFDGVELRVLSFSRQQQGIWHVCDATGCTCEGSRFEYCRHRMLFRLKLAEWAVTDPMLLRLRIIEQLMPVDEPPGDFLDSLNDQAWDDYGDVAPVAAFRLQRSQELANPLDALADQMFAA
jgi:hypothetical protein